MARPAFIMPKRYGQLIGQIADLENLRLAYVKTARGKRRSWGYLEFKEYAELNLLAIREQLLDGGWEQGNYREFTIFEPKPRLISALDFKDRLAQHAVCNIIGPLFDRALLPYTFACRTGMGTHAGICHVQAQLRHTQAGYFLKTDYRKYFPSIDRARLHELIARKVKCAKTLATLRAMVPATGYGLPIGSLTSQLFANVYGGVIDRFIHFDLGARAWARYMDDVVILGDSAARLRDWYARIVEVSQARLGLAISHWHVASVTRGINFLGFRIWPTHKLLRKRSVLGAKRKIALYLKHGEHDRLARFIPSWLGHARWADTHHLLSWLETRYAIAC